MAKWITASAAVLLTGAVSVALGSCGGSGGSSTARAAFAEKPGLQILKASLDAMSTVHAARLRGTYGTGGTTYSMDVSSDRSGACSGTISFGRVTGDIAVKDGVAYLHGDTDFLDALMGLDGLSTSSVRRVLSKVGDRWISGASNADIDQECDLDKAFGSLETVATGLDVEKSGTIALAKGPVIDVEGSRSVEVRLVDGSERVSFWIATDAPHYLTRVRYEDSGVGTLTFSAFNTPVDVRVPTGDDVIDSKMVPSLASR